MSINKIKIAVIGVGHLGNFHTRILGEIENVELLGVYDLNTERAKEIAEKYNTSYFVSLEEALKEADAVSIVAPTVAHYEIAAKCMEMGKDVFVEKPITTTVEEAEKLVAKAEEKKLIFQVGHVERFNAVMLKVQPLITNPRFIEVNRLGPYSFRGTDVGVVRDLMIHDIDIILHLVKSEIESIQAVGVNVISKTEDIANARIVFKNGCVANVNASRASLTRERKIRVFQEDAYLSIDYMNQKVKCYRKKECKGEPKSLLDYIEQDKIRIKKNEPLKEELISFVESVIARKDPVVTGQHGKKALEVVTQIIDLVHG